MKSLPLSVPHFCAPALPSPGNFVSVLYPSPSITTPCTQVMMQFMGGILSPYIATGTPPQVSFVLRVYGGLIISWTVSLPPLYNALLKYEDRRLYYSPALFYTVKLMSLQCTAVISVWNVKIDCSLSNFSFCACVLCWVSHCPSSHKSYSTGLGCFSRSDCAIKCSSSAALLCVYETVY